MAILFSRSMMTSLLLCQGSLSLSSCLTSWKHLILLTSFGNSFLFLAWCYMLFWVSSFLGPNHINVVCTIFILFIFCMYLWDCHKNILHNCLNNSSLSHSYGGLKSEIRVLGRLVPWFVKTSPWCLPYCLWCSSCEHAPVSKFPLFIRIPVILD